MDNFVIQDWIILLMTIFITVLVVFGLRWFLLIKPEVLNAEKKLPRQIAMLGITIVAIIAIVLALPVSESSRNQVLGLFGVLLSAVIAFSSTTIVTNLMAGLVLRLNKPFRAGDFIKCNGFEGRVTEKGVLDTEIQTRQRALVHLSNVYLIINPVEVIRSSGTLISAEVSIGYDVHHATVEQHLQDAALKVGLTDAFVHITKLGDFSIEYIVSGMLEDIKSILTVQSKLFAAILDELHSNDIEIMSPNMIAPRAVEPSQTFIAKSKVIKATETVNQEDLVFDKAEEAEKKEAQRDDIEQKITALKTKISKSKKIDDNAIELNDSQKKAAEKQLKALEVKLKNISVDMPKG